MPGVSSLQRRQPCRDRNRAALTPTTRRSTCPTAISGVVLFAMIGAATIAACAPQTAQHDAAADEAAVASTAANWEKAYNEKNADGVAAVYSEDAQLLPPGPAVVNGRAAIRDFWANDIVASNSTFAITADATGFGGDWAWRSGDPGAELQQTARPQPGNLSRSGAEPRTAGNCIATSGTSMRLRLRRKRRQQPALRCRGELRLPAAACRRERESARRAHEKSQRTRVSRGVSAGALRAGAGISGLLDDVSRIRHYFATMASPLCDSLCNSVRHATHILPILPTRHHEVLHDRFLNRLPSLSLQTTQPRHARATRNRRVRAAHGERQPDSLPLLFSHAHAHPAANPPRSRRSAHRSL